MATPGRYPELIAAGGGVALWIVLLITNGPLFALEAIWLLLIALGVGAWATLRRLRFSRSLIRVTLGPWSREADLRRLESIRANSLAPAPYWREIVITLTPVVA